MKVLKYDDANNNSEYLVNLIKSMTDLKTKCYWALSDLDFVPFFHGDYSGIGIMEKKWPAYTALEEYEKNNVIILDYKQLMQFLEDVQTLRNAVIICLEDNYKIDINNFHPKVESQNKDMYDNRAIYEIRILDGDLFYVISNSEGKHQIQPKNRVAIAAALNLIIPNCTNL